jgi:hypothetical protein
MTVPFPLHDFRIVEEFARGEFGIIYRAEWTSRGMEVALKQVRRGGGQDRLDAEKTGAVFHEQFATRYPDMAPEVFAHGEGPDGDYYIAMAFVHGETLARRLQRGPLAPRAAAELTLAIAEILHRLHTFRPDGQSDPKAIVHSDLKPANVLVLPDGSVRLVDFGITKQPTNAATANVFVSHAYASPERLEDGKVHPNEDAWALGVMLFEMVAGSHPWERFRSDGELSLAAAIRKREAPGPLPAVRRSQLDAIIWKMLQPQLHQRYQTVVNIAHDLRDFLGDRETAAARELRSRDSLTRPVRPPASATAVVPPTLPFIPAGVAAAGVAMLVRNPTATVQRGALPKAGMLVRALISLVFLAFLLVEGLGWVRVELLRPRLASLDASDIDWMRGHVQAARRWAPFDLGVRLRFAGPLTARMLTLAEPPILDFRTETPVMREARWTQAAAALDLALAVAPGDRTLRAKAKYVEGHLLRIGAQGKAPVREQEMLRAAVRAFEESARLDTGSHDPYLGLARIHAWDTWDFDALERDIEEAEARGYRPGRRERIQRGDGFMRRADTARRAADIVKGSERVRLMQEALSHYRNCVVQHAGVGDFYNSVQNLTRCQRRVDELEDLLGGLAP